MNEQNDKSECGGGECGPGCNCGSGGASKRAKWVICGVVAVAAVVVVAAKTFGTKAAESQSRQDYASLVPAAAPADAAKVVEAPTADGWGAPLKSLAELNVLATNTDAVFLVVPAADADRVAAIQKEVSAAAATIKSRGTRTGTYLLSKDAAEYAALVQQVGAPAVLAMCKGRGMAVVKDKEVTQDALLKAFVAASRPSSCGPSGCGPGSSGCN